MSVPITNEDEASQRITKLLPADITAAFIAIYSGVPAADLPGDWIVYGAVAIALLSPFYFRFALGTRNLIHIVFLILTFGVFVISLDPVNLGNVWPTLRPYFQGMSVIATPIWVFVVTPIVANVLKTKLEG